MKSLILLRFVLILLFVPLLTHDAFGAGRDTLWEKMTLAQKDYQNHLADLLAEAAPEARELVLLQRDLQLTLIDIRTRQYYFLLRNDPSRINRNEGITRWSNFDWSDKDNSILAKQDGDYSVLLKKKERLNQQIRGHPMWPRLREVFSSIRKSAEHKALLERLSNTFAEIEPLLDDK